MIAPALDRAVDAILRATANLPLVGPTAVQNQDFIKQHELSHLEALLNGDLDRTYFESCKRTVGQEAELGFDARLRSTAGNYVLRAALDTLVRKYWYSPAKLAASAKLVSQAIAFDVANAMTLHREAAEKAADVRRMAIDEAINGFAGDVGEVLQAISTPSSNSPLPPPTSRRQSSSRARPRAVSPAASRPRPATPRARRLKSSRSSRLPDVARPRSAKSGI